MKMHAFTDAEKTKPIKANTKPIKANTNPIQTQNEPNQTQPVVSLSNLFQTLHLQKNPIFPKISIISVSNFVPDYPTLGYVKNPCGYRRAVL